VISAVSEKDAPSVVPLQYQGSFIKSVNIEANDFNEKLLVFECGRKNKSKSDGKHARLHSFEVQHTKKSNDPSKIPHHTNQGGNSSTMKRKLQDSDVNRERKKGKIAASKLS